MDELLDMFLPRAPTIALDGTKGVGKTGTALQCATKALFLDRPDQRALVETDPDGIRRPETTLLDRWLRTLEVWDLVRREVDSGADPGSFLFIGSAAPATTQETYSGAGRILSLRMCSMTLHERGQLAPTVSPASLLTAEPPYSAEVEGHTPYCLVDYLDATAASGFPGVISLNPDLQTEQLATYIQRVIDRDLPDLDYGMRRPEALHHWLATYAAASPTATSCSKLFGIATCGDDQQPARDTTQTYRGHLIQLWLLDPVPGRSPSRSLFTRLQQAPEHQLADLALAASLLGTTVSFVTIPRHSHLAGLLSEALATFTVRVATEAVRARMDHLHTRNGDYKIDLTAETRDGRIVTIEVKLIASVTDPDVQHLV